MNKIVYGLIAIIAIALFIIFSGFGRPFEIVKYPITARFNVQGTNVQNTGLYQLTLYENGSGFFETPGGNYSGYWEIVQKKASEIRYVFTYEGYGRQMTFALYTDHRAIMNPGREGWSKPHHGYWDYTEYLEQKEDAKGKNITINFQGVVITLKLHGTSSSQPTAFAAAGGGRSGRQRSDCE